MKSFQNHLKEIFFGLAPDDNMIAEDQRQEFFRQMVNKAFQEDPAKTGVICFQILLATVNLGKI